MQLHVVEQYQRLPVEARQVHRFRDPTVPGLAIALATSRSAGGAQRRDRFARRAIAPARRRQPSPSRARARRQTPAALPLGDRSGDPAGAEGLAAGNCLRTTAVTSPSFADMPLLPAMPVWTRERDESRRSPTAVLRFAQMCHRDPSGPDTRVGTAGQTVGERFRTPSQPSTVPGTQGTKSGARQRSRLAV
jgi:hypothetical protein